MEVLALREAAKVDDPPLYAAMVEGMDVIARAMHLYVTPPTAPDAAPRSALVFSFNGGKDSTVVLHLLRGVLAERYGVHVEARPPSHTTTASATTTTTPHTTALPSAVPPPSAWCGGLVPVVYFESPSNFPAVLAFMTECDGRYGFTTRAVPEFKAGITLLRGEGACAVLMGTRKTDPHGGSLQHFTPTTLNWPPLMRVCPILHWTYRMVWAFLRRAGLPYCCLYDQGYTSLGSVTDSVPNPALARTPPPPHPRADATTATHPATFSPAYELGDDALERAGRGGRPGPATAPAPSLHRQPRAAIVVIGDEVLSGRVRDANGPFLCARLAAAGMQVVHIATIPDDADTIATTVRRLSSECDAVLTCGGLGPTHDDVTLVGVAAAFSYPLRTCAAMARFLTALYRRTHGKGRGRGGDGHDGDQDAGLQVFLRMATLPAGVDVMLHYPDGSTAPAFPMASLLSPISANSGLMGDTPTPCSIATMPDDALPPPSASPVCGAEAEEAEEDRLVARGYPLACVRNVYLFPGVPAIVRRKFRAHAAMFTGPTATTELVRVAASEHDLAPVLEACLRDWKGAPPAEAAATPAPGTVDLSRVRLGSYPADDDPFSAVYLMGSTTSGSSSGGAWASPDLTPRAGGSGAEQPPVLRLSDPAMGANGGGGGSGSVVTVSVTAVGPGSEAAVAAAVASLTARLGTAGWHHEAPSRVDAHVGPPAAHTTGSG